MPTIPELVRRAVAAHGPRIAVVDGTRTLTFAQVGDRMNRLANVLAAVAVEPGRCVAILMRNRLEYIEADLAIALAGLVKVPINPRLSDDERSYILQDTAAAVLITESSELDRVLTMLGGISTAPHVLVVDGVKGNDYEALLGSASAIAPKPVTTSESDSLLLYTSGTTGRPKGAILTDGNRVASTQAMLAEEFCPGIDDGMIHAGPLSHGSGSKVLSFFTRGARNVVMAKFDPEAFQACAQSLGGTSTFLVPTMIQMLVEASAERPWSGGLRNISYGGASISPETLVGAIRTFGPILTQVYGSCESPHPVTVLRHREERDPAFESSDTIPAGRIVASCEMRVVVDEAEQANDGRGEMWVRGPNVMRGYWAQPAATASALTDGWYHTGDVVRVDDEGLISIVDRVKDMIISGGLNVYPAEVERVLRTHPMISDVCVVGVPNARWGEVVAAGIVLRPDASLDAVAFNEWCDQRLAGYKRPRIAEILEELPKGTTGKVLKASMRELLERRAAADDSSGGVR